MNAPEGNIRITVSIALLIVLLIVGFSFGGLYFRFNAMERYQREQEEIHEKDVILLRVEMEKMEDKLQEAHRKDVEYLNEEDDGVRSDFEKEDEHINKEIDILREKDRNDYD